MTLRPALSGRHQKSWLHLLLVAGILVYLYSPLVDHWLGNGTHSRPHDHTHVAAKVVQAGTHPVETAFAEQVSRQGEPEDGVLCLLDIDALLGLVLTLSGAPAVPLEPYQPLAAGLSRTYLDISIIYLTLLDPPPNI